MSSAPPSLAISVGRWPWARFTQIQTIGAARPEVTEANRAELRWVLTDLKARVEVEAPPEKKDAALERVEELEEAITAEEPDLTTIEYVKIEGAMVSGTSHKGDQLHAEVEIVFAHLNDPRLGSLFNPEVFLGMMQLLGAFDVGHAADGSRLQPPARLLAAV